MSGVLSLQLCLPFHLPVCQCGWVSQVRMMLLFLERVFILSRSLVMRGVDEFFLSRAWRTDLESE